MKKNIPLILPLFLLIMGCSQKDKKPINKIEKQLNISILIDLSDRIDPKTSPSSPSHYVRDISIVKTITKLFKETIKEQGAYKAKDKFQILFSPEPEDPNINTLAQKLKVNLSKLENKEKKKIYNNIDNDINTNLSQIYDTSIKAQKWIGSDIWRFFKNDISNYCIEKEPYRNILVILTDGYIYHEASKDKEKNRYSYITADLFEKYKLRNNPEWKENIKRNDFGLITKRNDLKNLEVLILEITPSKGYQNDEDIIKEILRKWFQEMGVQKLGIYNTALPANSEKLISDFFK